MGLTAAGLVVLGLVLGRWLDARLGTAPLATLLCIVVSAVAGQIAIYRLALSSAERLSASTRSALRLGDALAGAGFALRVLAVMILPGLAGLGLGLWLDRLLSTRAIATLVLALGGVVLGLVLALRLAYRRRANLAAEGDGPCSGETKGS